MELRRRLRILLYATLPLILGGIILNVLSRANIIERDPALFDGRKLTAVYETDHGVVTIEKKIKKDRFYEISGEHEGVIKSGDLHGDQDIYTPFWLNFTNPILALKTQNPQYQICDETGLLGPAHEQYIALQEKSFILWDENLQSQASYQFSIFDQHNNRVATAVYDATCGMLFRLTVKKPDRPDLRLIHTDFPISRNRVWFGIFYFFISIILIYFFTIRTRGKEGLAFEKARWSLVLVLLGILCIATDTLLDLWYPFFFGKAAPVIWHSFLVLVILALGHRAAIPAFIELLMMIGFWVVLKAPAPTLAFIPGVTMSFVMMLGSLAEKTDILE